jgi:hypothetical protein
MMLLAEILLDRCEDLTRQTHAMTAEELKALEPKRSEQTGGQMKIEIKRFKVTVHGGPGHDRYSVIIEEPTPSEAMAVVRYEHKLPIGAKLTAKPVHSKFIETEAL